MTEIMEQVEKALGDIRPALQADGGDIEPGEHADDRSLRRARHEAASRGCWPGGYATQWASASSSRYFVVVRNAAAGGLRPAAGPSQAKRLLKGVVDRRETRSSEPSQAEGTIKKEEEASSSSDFGLFARHRAATRARDPSALP